MTILAEAPAAIMQMAAEFAHTDFFKEGLCGIHLQSIANGMRIAATNGHFAFRCIVPFSDHCYIAQEQLLVPAAAFKKKVAYSKKVSILDGEARFCGGKKDTMTLLEARPLAPSCPTEKWTFPSHFDTLWPALETLDNEPGGFIAFNPEYMRTICDVVAKCPDAGRLQLYTSNNTTSPMVLTATACETALDELLLEFLLLPLAVRRD
jgi:hypothetical protein